jgi:hypothetical protein
MTPRLIEPRLTICWDSSGGRFTARVSRQTTLALAAERQGGALYLDLNSRLRSAN